MTGLPDGVDRALRVLAAVALERRQAYDALDAVTGDGDFGSTFARGAAAVVRARPDSLRTAGLAFAAAAGGSSGALLGAALVRLDGHGLADDSDADRVSAALLDADAAVAELGGAALGDKTLRDALHPAATALRDGGVTAAVAAARSAAYATAGLTARRGRSAYAGERSVGAVDPGAVAVADVLEAWVAGEPPTWEALLDRVGEPAGEDAGSAEDDRVDRAVAGLVASHPSLRRLPGVRAVVRADAGAGSEGAPRVVLVSGGGAGHEPLHAGFVGAGMLDAACPGAVFTSPSSAQVLAAAEAVDQGAGVLFVVKAYTGDVLNFGLAAQSLGGTSATVLVADDVATAVDDGPGRRGTGATVAVEKLAGALAAEGADLGSCRALGQAVADDARSYGIAFRGEEMEQGVGIHGEPGRPREPRRHGSALAHALCDPLLAEVDPAAPLLVLLSGLGGTALLDLQATYADVVDVLTAAGRTVVRSLVGDLVTSLDQPGMLLTLVPFDERRTALWDAPVSTPALTW
ncbi:dihydroxyacetone kinase subunit DhaK [Microlunatus sagamiharensis]|nr:dihydroxyacetone kinase subunit DhaK [Microlunatus sagamiharensis]